MYIFLNSISQSLRRVCPLHENILYFPKDRAECTRGVMVKAMACGTVVIELELQSRYYIHFRVNTLGIGIEPPYPPSYGLNSTTTVF